MIFAVILLLLGGAIWWMQKNQIPIKIPAFGQDKAVAGTTSTVTVKAAEPEKKKKAKKVEFAFSYLLLLYIFVVMAFMVPPMVSGSLSTGDTWLLVVLISVAAAFAASTVLNSYFDYDATLGIANKVAIGVLIVGFVVLLMRNNFSTTAALKDAGALSSDVTSGLVDVLAGKRGGGETQQTFSSNSSNPSSAPAGFVAPANALPSVTVPSCNEGWSKTVSIPGQWNVTSAWNMDTVQASWRENGVWKTFEDKYLSGSFDAVKYCAKNSSYAGEEMLLTWIPR